jgi:hypothetical protein
MDNILRATQFVDTFGEDEGFKQKKSPRFKIPAQNCQIIMHVCTCILENDSPRKEPLTSLRAVVNQQFSDRPDKLCNCMPFSKDDEMYFIVEILTLGYKVPLVTSGNGLQRTLVWWPWLNPFIVLPGRTMTHGDLPETLQYSCGNVVLDPGNAK